MNPTIPTTIKPDPKTQELVKKVNDFTTAEEKKITAKPEKDLIQAVKTEDEMMKGIKLQDEAAKKAEEEKNRIGLYRDSTKALERGEEDFSNTIRQKNIDFVDLQTKNDQYVHNMTFARSGKDYGTSLKGMQGVNTALSQAREVMQQAETIHGQSMKRLAEDYGQGVIEITRNLYRNVDDAKLNVYSKLNQMQLTGELETAEDIRAAHQALSDQYTKDLTVYADTHTRAAQFLYDRYQAEQQLARDKEGKKQSVNQEMSKLQRVYVNDLGQKILDANGKTIPFREDVMTVTGTDGTMYEIDPISKQIVGQYNITGQVQDIETNKNALKNLSQGSQAAVNIINKVTGTYARNSNKYPASIQPDGGIKFDTAKYENQSLVRGWCGQFVNDSIKAGMGDTWESKMTTVNKAKSSIPLPGMAFIQNTGTKEGHTGLIEQVYDYDGDGQPDAIDIVESNYNVKGGIDRQTIKKGDARWNQIYQYGFYDPAQGSRTYTNPNAKSDEFSPQEITMFNNLTAEQKNKMTPADKTRQNAFLKKKQEVFDQTNKNVSMEDILEFSKGSRGITGTQEEKLDKTLSSYAQFTEIAEQIKAMKKFEQGPIIGVIRNWNPYDTEGQSLKAKITGLIPQLARGVFGEVGVLTDSDVERYRQVIPNLKGTKDYNLAVTSYLNRVMAGAIKSKLRTMASAGYDVSLMSGIYYDITRQAEDIEKQLGIDKVGGGTGSVKGTDIKAKYGYSSR